MHFFVPDHCDDEFLKTRLICFVCLRWIIKRVATSRKTLSSTFPEDEFVYCSAVGPKSSTWELKGCRGGKPRSVVLSLVPPFSAVLSFHVVMSSSSMARSHNFPIGICASNRNKLMTSWHAIQSLASRMALNQKQHDITNGLACLDPKVRKLRKNKSRIFWNYLCPIILRGCNHCARFYSVSTRQLV